MSDAANLYLYYGNTGDGTLSVRINAQGDSYLNGGNVGIGTTLPKTSLDIVKDSDIWHLMVGGSTKKLLVGGQAVSGDVVLQAGAASTVNNAAVTTPYNLCLQRDGGNVGIGTPSPGTNKLYVDGGESTFNRGNSEGAIVRFRGKNAEKAVIGTVDSWFSSNVGIGTTSPDAQLELKKETTWGTLDNQVLYINNTGTGGNTGLLHDMGSITWRRIRNTPGSGNNVDLRFTTATQSGGQQTSMTILSGGNVGIGTTDPTAKLHLYVNSTNDDTFQIFNGSVRTHLLASESSNGVIYMRSSANSNTIRINASGDSYFNGGNVGIGATSLTAKLHVDGSTRVTGDLYFDTTSTALYKIKKDGTSLQIWGNAIVPAIEVLNTGVLKLGVYALSGLGTPTHLLGVDGSGNVVKTNSFNLELDDTPAASTASGNIVNWSVSESTTAGSLYVVKTNGGWQTTDADTEAKSIGMLAIALGSNATAGMLLQGFFYKASHGFTIGLPLYISNTAGAFSTTRPTGTNDYVRIIGYATSANYIYFDPDKTWVKLQ